MVEETELLFELVTASLDTRTKGLREETVDAKELREEFELKTLGTISTYKQRIPE
jgi:hypothetical protein